MKKIFAICGSTRQNSVSLELLKIIATFEKETIELQIFTQIDYLPHYNPDIDNPEINIKNLQDYYNSLDNLLKKYATSHSSITK